jgi:hypothetical protein
MGPRYVYKDMLDDLVSPLVLAWIIKINSNKGKWGHVIYNLPLFGDLWQHKQSKHKFAKIDKIRATYTCLDAYQHLKSP